MFFKVVPEYIFTKETAANLFCPYVSIYCMFLSRIQSPKDKIVRLCLDGAAPCVMRFCTRLVMISYALLMMKPVMPILMDNMAHSLWAKQHYRVAHKHGGEEHVHFELQKIEKEDDRGKGQVRHEWQTDTAPHVAATAPAFNGIRRFYPRPVYADYACRYPVIYTIPDYPPPRV